MKCSDALSQNSIVNVTTIVVQSCVVIVTSARQLSLTTCIVLVEVKFIQLLYNVILTEARTHLVVILKVFPWREVYFTLLQCTIFIIICGYNTQTQIEFKKSNKRQICRFSLRYGCG